MGWYNEKKMTDQYSDEKRCVFSFDLKEESENECLTVRRKRVPDHRSYVLKGFLPQGPSAHPRSTEDPSIWGWAKRTRGRVGMKQLRAVWRSCTRDNVEADDVLILAADCVFDWQVRLAAFDLQSCTRDNVEADDVLNPAADCMFDWQLRLAVSGLQVMSNGHSATYRRGSAKVSLPG